MPAQPPFLIPTRSPATGLPAASVSSRTRAAPASVRVITCRRNSRDAISSLRRPGSRPGGCPTYSIRPSVLTGRRGPPLLSIRPAQDPVAEYANRAGQEEHGAGPNDESDIAASIGGHHEPERDEKAPEGGQQDIHGFAPLCEHAHESAAEDEAQGRCGKTPPTPPAPEAFAPSRRRTEGPVCDPSGSC